MKTAYQPMSGKIAFIGNSLTMDKGGADTVLANTKPRAWQLATEMACAAPEHMLFSILDCNMETIL